MADEIAVNGPRNRPGTGERPLDQRSAVTNGRRLFVAGGDGRSPWARRLRDIMELHISDLGGIDAMSEAEHSIVRRAATITIELERLEAKFSAGEAVEGDLDLYQRGANSLRRLLETVGLERRARDVTPDLRTYLKEMTCDTANHSQKGPQ